MPAPNTISIEKLVRLVGTPKCPTLIDVRAEDEFDADPHLIPSSRHYTFEKLGVSSEVPGSQPAVVICQEGTSLSQGRCGVAPRQGCSSGGVGGWVQSMEASKASIGSRVQAPSH